MAGEPPPGRVRKERIRAHDVAANARRHGFSCIMSANDELPWASSTATICAARGLLIAIDRDSIGTRIVRRQSQKRGLKWHLAS
jgi:hypothetical protein